MHLFIGGPFDGKRRYVERGPKEPIPSVQIRAPQLTESDYADRTKPIGSPGALYTYMRHDFHAFKDGREVILYVYMHLGDERSLVEALVEGYRNG